MSNRPFFYKTIDELEELFSKEGSNQACLKKITFELKHRNTPRAVQLRKKAFAALEANNLSSKQQIIINETVKSAAETQKINNKAVEPKLETGLVEIEPTPSLHPISFQATKKIPEKPQNQPHDILSAWMAMEVLSPPVFKKPSDLTGDDNSRIVKLEENFLPWLQAKEKSKPNYRLYYQIILATINVSLAYEKLLKVYNDDRVEKPQIQGEALLAVITVDNNGVPVEPDAISLSSFGWGLPVALTGHLENLGQWPAVEESLTQALAKQLFIKNDDDKIQPLTVDQLTEAYQWLVKKFRISQDIVKPGGFLIKAYQYYKISSPPESLFLNSFFIQDLALAQQLAQEKRLPFNLQRYLGMIKPAEQPDLLNNKKLLQQSLQPKNFPKGAWPSSGRHPLVLLQQSAVNLAMQDLKEKGILAVNGPPGTGKTTLLRDIIAALITERAAILATYDDPETAFRHSGQTIKRGNSFLHLYSLEQKLHGYEIIVASSNNKAVENISEELPSKKAVTADSHSLRYFKTISDALLGKGPDNSWGVIAAVLGNQQNKSKFRNSFWWDDDTGLQGYLKQISGTPQLITKKQEDGDITQRPAEIVENEDPPRDHDDALQRWKKAKSKFQESYAATTHALSELQKIADFEIFEENELALLNQLNIDLEKISALKTQVGGEIAKVKTLLATTSNQIQEIEKIRLKPVIVAKPGFLAKIFQAKKCKDWKEQYQQVQHDLTIARNKHLETEKLDKKLAQKLDEIVAQENKLLSQINHKQQILTGKKLQCQQIIKEYADQVFNKKFMEKDRAAFHLSAPWLNKAVIKLRQDLFENSMLLHKAFIDAAAKPIRHNLNILMDDFGTRSLGDAEKDKFINHLWATFFLVVPVVSTTFASINRMFKNISPNTFGWLLIDEAGQAVPQAAVGALMRTQKAMVVGDPIQIEPVVTLPNQLTEIICQQFKIDSLLYNAPATSVQKLADLANDYCANFDNRKVGVPLLVHRRCANPMFSISNMVAYDNLMITAKSAGKSPIKSVLGTSRWIDVASTSADDKWCAKEAATVLQLLSQLKENNCEPNLYIVTPFVVIQNKMREAILSSNILEGWVEVEKDEDERKAIYAWCYKHIGTVHTVQGREAEAVVFVLGASGPGHMGARSWAGKQPNLLNVAVTRAKECLYVVGNRELWKNAGQFSKLHQLLN
jgi:hypothetical protein